MRLCLWCRSQCPPTDNCVVSSVVTNPLANLSERYAFTKQPRRLTYSNTMSIMSCFLQRCHLTRLKHVSFLNGNLWPLCVKSKWLWVKCFQKTNISSFTNSVSLVKQTALVIQLLVWAGLVARFEPKNGIYINIVGNPHIPWLCYECEIGYYLR